MKKNNMKSKRKVVRRTSPPSYSSVLMARQIASDIFDLGTLGTERPNRISFKLGKYGVDEYDGSGLCEKAFVDEIAYSIRRRFMPNPKVRHDPLDGVK